MAFSLEAHDDLHAAVVRIEGDIDLAVVPELQAGLEEAIASGVSSLVLDLEGVDYADSSALGLLVWLDRKLAEVDGKVALVKATPNVARVLEISGIVTVAETVCEIASVEEALGSIEAPEERVEPLWREEFVIAAAVSALAPARERVASTIRPLGYSDAAVFDVKVALGEALANAIRHGSPEGDASSVRVQVLAFPDQVAIEVEDSGTGFDGQHACGDDLYAAGGRGIMFMRALMDRVVFSEGPQGGTLVTMFKYRGPSEAD